MKKGYPEILVAYCGNFELIDHVFYVINMLILSLDSTTLNPHYTAFI